MKNIFCINVRFNVHLDYGIAHINVRINFMFIITVLINNLIFINI